MRISHNTPGLVSAATTWKRWAAALAIFPALIAFRGSEGIAQAAEAASGGDETPAETNAAETSTAAPAGAAGATNHDTSADVPAEKAMVEPPMPPPRGVHPIPATLPPFAQAPASYVEDLGPESFPGRSRGLYGGSLWLEPSFHGLQWPYMAHTGIGISGNLWADLGYETIKRGQDLPAEKAFLITDATMSVLQTRGVLRVTPTYVRGNFFIQGQIEAVGTGCQVQAATNTVCASGGFGTDDLWLRFGQWNRWDIKVGRFEAWEIYHLGMGLDQYTVERLGAGMFGVDPRTTPPLEVPSFYGATFLHDRPADGFGTGYAAFHAYMTDYLRFELLGKLGNDNYRSDASTGQSEAYTYTGARPTVVFDLGWLKLKAGYEYAKRSPTTQSVESGTPGKKKDPVAGRTQSGFGASLQFVFDPLVEFGVSAARGKQEDTNGFAQMDPANSYTTTTVGGFANLRLADLWLLGLGVHRTSQTDEVVSGGNNDYTSNLQTFAALQYLLGGQLFIKGVLAYEQAYFQPADNTVPTWKNSMYSARVRLMYIF